MELFAKIINGFQQLFLQKKNAFLHVRLGSECASAIDSDDVTS